MVANRRSAVALLSLLLAACGSDPEPTCGAPGATSACLCSGGVPGSQSCRADGTWNACQCAPTADTSADADTGGTSADADAADTSADADAGATSAGCGDGELEGLEECDDGNTDYGDGCSSKCLRELSLGEVDLAGRDDSSGPPEIFELADFELSLQYTLELPDCPDCRAQLVLSTAAGQILCAHDGATPHPGQARVTMRAPRAPGNHVIHARPVMAASCDDAVQAYRDDPTLLTAGEEVATISVVSAPAEFEIRRFGSDQCADVDYASLDPGARLILGGCSGNDNQRFTSTAPTDSGDRTLSVAHSGLCLTVQGTAGQTGTGDPAVQDTCGGANQSFRLHAVGGGYQLVPGSAAAGGCLGFEQQALDTPLEQLACKERGDAGLGLQLFQLEDSPSGPSLPSQFFAVFIDDSGFEGTCSPTGAHGADIDAVALYDGDTRVAYLDTVELGTDSGGSSCESVADFSAASAALGPPDGDSSGGFVSLNGGWLVGEFEWAAEIVSGYSLRIYEVGSDEAYDIYIAGELGCVHSGPSFRTDCMLRIGSEVVGEATVLVTGF